VIVLGIDPGSRFTGYGVVRSAGSRLELIAEGCLRSDQADGIAPRLASLAGALEELVTSFQPEAVVVESLFHGVNTRSLIVLAQARGAILATLGRLGLNPVELTPAEVKRAVTGNGRADKQQVARMVGVLLALPPRRRSADTTDALALAICYGQLAKGLERRASSARALSARGARVNALARARD
jgi:crossover junction endodeoxyribonuclease RuvC